ncbi:hypothetical protein Ddye_016761 [Dipteronia dyeriana]|uniref:Uncharacterized protein n=1 Tax=Dipteronia dyeriana TaxID=168575 RepID=A0AAD9U895_9ROSI|nr:hypothetical protein Ddye_016761 [Dipteronia dyeriana]
MKMYSEGTKKTEKQRRVESNQNEFYGPRFRDYEEQIYMGGDVDDQQIKMSDCGRKRKIIGSYFMPRTTSGYRPIIKSVLQAKKRKEKKCDLAASKWMIDAKIPLNDTNSMYYHPMFDVVAAYGGGYKGHRFHDLRGYFLNKNVVEIKKFVIVFALYGKNIDVQSMLMGGQINVGEPLIFFWYIVLKVLHFLSPLILPMHQKQ